MLALRFAFPAFVMLAASAACGHDDTIPEGSVPPGGVIGDDDDDAATGSTSGGSTSSSSSSGAAPAPWVVTDQSVQAAGMQHDYVLVVPRAPTQASLPIVVAYHGDVGNGRGLYEQWRVQETTGNDAIVDVPLAQAGKLERVRPCPRRTRTWPASTPCIDAIVSQPTAATDARQVTATGWSAGGFFSQIIACWRGAAAAFGQRDGGQLSRTIPPAPVGRSPTRSPSARAMVPVPRR